MSPPREASPKEKKMRLFLVQMSVLASFSIVAFGALFLSIFPHPAVGILVLTVGVAGLVFWLILWSRHRRSDWM